MCGDFNTVFDRALDRAAPTSLAFSGRVRWLSPTVKFRQRNLAISSPRCLCRWNGSLSSRIDMIGVPFSWVPSMSKVFICPCPFSDHCTVTLSLSIPDFVLPGPELWKLKISVLQDQDYVDLITAFWCRWRLTQARLRSLSKSWEKRKFSV